MTSELIDPIPGEDTDIHGPCDVGTVNTVLHDATATFDSSQACSIRMGQKLAATPAERLYNWMGEAARLTTRLVDQLPDWGVNKILRYDPHAPFGEVKDATHVTECPYYDVREITSVNGH